MAHPKGERYKVTWNSTDVPGLLSFDHNMSRDTIETTDFDSGTDKEFVPGDSEHDFSLEFQFDVNDADQQAALADWNDGTSQTLTIEPVSSQTGDLTWSGTAFATSVSDTYSKAEIVAFTVELKATGSVTQSFAA